MQFSLQENTLRILLVRWLSVRSAGHQAVTLASSLQVEGPAYGVALAVFLVKLLELLSTHALGLG